MENENTTTLVSFLTIYISKDVQNWTTFIVSILGGFWILIQIVDKLRKWNKK